jgi:uncharacterized glyoxalase superfamily protein PhnB
MPAATVIPVLHYPDVAVAAEWLCRAFGFAPHLRIGTHRMQLEVGDAAVVIAQSQSPESASEKPRYSIMVRVTDVDRHFELAKRADCRVLGAPASYPYGERQYTVLDLAGHAWTFSQSVADVDPAEWGGERVRSV